MNVARLLLFIYFIYLAGCIKAEPDVNSLNSIKSALEIDASMMQNGSVCLLPQMSRTLKVNCNDRRIQKIFYAISGSEPTESWAAILDISGNNINCSSGTFDFALPGLISGLSNQKLYLKAQYESAESEIVEGPVLKINTSELSIPAGATSQLQEGQPIRFNVSGGQAPYYFKIGADTAPWVTEENLYAPTVTANSLYSLKIKDSECAPEISHDIYIVNDSTPPSVEIQSASLNPTNANFILAKAVLLEPVARLELNDLSCVNCTLSQLSKLSDLEYEFRVTPSPNTNFSVSLAAGKITDLNGNPNTVSNLLQGTHDNVRPRLNIDPNDTRYFKGSPANLELNFNENITNLSLEDFELAFPGDGYYVAGISGTGLQYSININYDFSSSVYVASFIIPAGSVSDAAGNLNDEQTFSITFDNESPAITDFKINDGDTYTSSVNVNLTVSAASALASPSLHTLKFFDNSSCSEPPGDSTGWVRIQPATQKTLTAGEGAKAISAQLKDNAGNLSNCISRSIILDTLKPDPPTDVTVGHYSNVLNQSPAISFSASSDSSGIAYHKAKIVDSIGNIKKDWTQIESGQSLSGFTLANGTSYKIIMRAYDIAGNVSDDTIANVDSTWLVDTLSPVFPPQSLTLNGIAIPNKPPTLAWAEEANDGTSGSGVLQNQIKIWTVESVPVAVSDWINITNGQEITLSSSPLTAGSKYTYELRAIDRAGNISNSLASADWEVFADCSNGAPAIGGVCAGGAVYAGIYDWDGPGSISNGDKYMVLPSGCGYDGSNNFSCVSGLKDYYALYWNDGAFANHQSLPGTIISTPSAPDHSDARAATEEVASIDSNLTLTNFQAHQAAKYCADLTYGGYSDWYLPNKSELAYLFCKSKNLDYNNFGLNKTMYPNENIGCGPGNPGTSGNLDGWNNYYYWSISKSSASQAWLMSFDSGVQYPMDKAGSFNVRCVRRY
jgi:hypothetical protein